MNSANYIRFENSNLEHKGNAFFDYLQTDNAKASMKLALVFEKYPLEMFVTYVDSYDVVDVPPLNTEEFKLHLEMHFLGFKQVTQYLMLVTKELMIAWYYIVCEFNNHIKETSGEHVDDFVEELKFIDTMMPKAEKSFSNLLNFALDEQIKGGFTEKTYYKTLVVNEFHEFLIEQLGYINSGIDESELPYRAVPQHLLPFILFTHYNNSAQLILGVLSEVPQLSDSCHTILNTLNLMVELLEAVSWFTNPIDENKEIKQSEQFIIQIMVMRKNIRVLMEDKAS
ncbi:MAG: hypothetical protein ATN36_02645 [Epulopiscium sp. Nele67-Bin005]|nr:MAG: hypothetical protein ATN36_02645 [Epulopiscium sp. Nele67-Bin005]